MTNTAQDLILQAVEEAGFTLVDGRIGKIVRTADATTNSLKIAEIFGKRHDNVLQAYRNLVSETSLKVRRSTETCAKVRRSTEIGDFRAVDPDAQSLDDFVRLNFKEETYLDAGGRSYPMVTMTRKGFEFLTLGFTGRKAMMFRMAYVERFHAMETQIADNASKGATLAYRKPPFVRKTIDYGKGAIVCLKENNPDYAPVPAGIQVAYNEDTLLFMETMRGHA